MTDRMMEREIEREEERERYISRENLAQCRHLHVRSYVCLFVCIFLSTDVNIFTVGTNRFAIYL